MSGCQEPLQQKDPQQQLLTPDWPRRSWNVDKKGELTPAAARDKAHTDRVTAVVWHKNFLYSTSYSGSLKMWDGNTLELVAEVPAAHGGGRIHCAAAGPDGYLYTGGDDKVCTV